MSEQATGCRYDLPAGWVHLDLDPARRSASVRRAVAERVRREPRLTPHLAQLDRALRIEAELAAAAGARRVSLLAEPVAGRAVTAGLTLTVERLGPGAIPAPEPPTAATIWAGLQAEHVRALESDPAAEVELVSLPAALPAPPPQAAVRRRWVQASASTGGSVRELTLQLLVPWPGRPDVALLSLSSVCEPIWSLLEATFDACVASFRWAGGSIGPH